MQVRSKLPETFPALRDNVPDNMPEGFSSGIITSLCELLAEGLPLKHAKKLLGIERQYKAWHKFAPEYIDSLTESAESQFIGGQLSTIRKASERSWQAAAWLLERRFPKQFALAGRTAGRESGVNFNLMVVSGIPRPEAIAKLKEPQMLEQTGETLPVITVDIEEASNERSSTGS